MSAARRARTPGPQAGPQIVRSVEIAGNGLVADVHIENGRISAIEPTSRAAGAARLVALPGLVDLHTHLREPGGEAAETIRSGTAAAAAGGFTDVFAMANTDPVTDSVERVRALRSRATAASARVHPVAAATVGLRGERLVDFAALAAEGVTVFSDDGRCVTDDALALEVLSAMARNGTVFAQHAQDHQLVGDGVINEPVAARAGAPGWPAAGEERIVARDLELAERTGGALHVCHVSTAGTVELVRAAKRRGVPVTAEVTPHHLLLSDEDALRAGARLKVNPPLRGDGDRAALLAGLRDGTIDAVATDHAPHEAASKAGDWRHAAFGLTALETALPLVIEIFTREDGDVDWESIMKITSFRPARIGGIATDAGRPIRVGEPATFTVVAATPGQIRADHQRSLSRNTPFEGRPVGWAVRATYLNGTPSYDAGA